MKEIYNVKDIDMSTREGQLLVAALGRLMGTFDYSKYVVEEIIIELNEILPSSTFKPMEG